MADTTDRVPRLVRNAVNLRSLVGQYRSEARAALYQARQQQALGNRDAVRQHLEDAQKARRKAAKCASFANLCEGRAETMMALISPITSDNFSRR